MAEQGSVWRADGMGPQRTCVTRVNRTSKPRQDTARVEVRQCPLPYGHRSAAGREPGHQGVEVDLLLGRRDVPSHVIEQTDQATLSPRSIRCWLTGRMGEHGAADWADRLRRGGSLGEQIDWGAAMPARIVQAALMRDAGRLEREPPATAKARRGIFCQAAWTVLQHGTRTTGLCSRRCGVEEQPTVVKDGVLSQPVAADLWPMLPRSEGSAEEVFKALTTGQREPAYSGLGNIAINVNVARPEHVVRKAMRRSAVGDRGAPEPAAGHLIGPAFRPLRPKRGLAEPGQRLDRNIVRRGWAALVCLLSRPRQHDLCRRPEPLCQRVAQCRERIHSGQHHLPQQRKDAAACVGVVGRQPGQRVLGQAGRRSRF